MVTAAEIGLSHVMKCPAMFFYAENVWLFEFTLPTNLIP